MNIFILDKDLEKSVQYHIDAHVSKIPLEAAQLLSTALWIDHVLGYTPRAITKNEKKELDKYIEKSIFDRDNPRYWYRPSYHNHGCNIWCRSSNSNFSYVKEYALALGREKLFRRPHLPPHKSLAMVELMPDKLSNCPVDTWTFPYLAMPDDYREQAIDEVDAYRTYYICEKHSNSAGNPMNVWTNRNTPPWWINMRA